MNMLFKICPRCGSKRVKWIIPQNWSTWECYDCDYTGPIIEGNEELSEEIREAYLESQNILRKTQMKMKSWKKIKFLFSQILHLKIL